MTEDDLQKQEDEQPIVPYGYTQNKIRKKKRFARALRNHFKSLFFNHFDDKKKRYQCQGSTDQRRTRTPVKF